MTNQNLLLVMMPYMLCEACISKKTELQYETRISLNILLPGPGVRERQRVIIATQDVARL